MQMRIESTKGQIPEAGWIFGTLRLCIQTSSGRENPTKPWYTYETCFCHLQVRMPKCQTEMQNVWGVLGWPTR